MEVKTDLLRFFKGNQTFSAQLSAAEEADIFSLLFESLSEFFELLENPKFSKFGKKKIVSELPFEKLFSLKDDELKRLIRIERGIRNLSLFKDYRNRKDSFFVDDKEIKVDLRVLVLESKKIFNLVKSKNQKLESGGFDHDLIIQVIDCLHLSHQERLHFFEENSAHLEQFSQIAKFLECETLINEIGNCIKK